MRLRTRFMLGQSDLPCGLRRPRREQRSAFSRQRLVGLRSPLSPACITTRSLTLPQGFGRPAERLLRQQSTIALLITTIRHLRGLFLSGKRRASQSERGSLIPSKQKFQWWARLFRLFGLQTTLQSRSWSRASRQNSLATVSTTPLPLATTHSLQSAELLRSLPTCRRQQQG